MVYRPRPQRSSRFDTVILDELAGNEPAYVALAGSKADRTLLLVGDFPQNAPVAEVDDVEAHQDRELSDSQRRDPFYLAGTCDRASAGSILLDLMQDGQPRWTGAANLNGSELEVAAAKFLNVALTRMKTKLYSPAVVWQ